MPELFVAGHGVVDSECFPIHSKVQQYDERLFFKRNDANGDFCLFVKMPRPHNEYNPPFKPVRGWQSMPMLDEVFAWIHKWDTLRNGDRILKEIDDHNELARDVYRKRVKDAEGNASEQIEHVLRKNGLINTFVSTRPRG